MSFTHPTPADWDVWAPLETDRQLIARYRVSSPTITRLRKVTGLYRTVGTFNKPRPVPADFAAKAKVLHQAALERHYDACRKTVSGWLRASGIKPMVWAKAAQASNLATVTHIWRDTSLAGECAEFLRKKDPIFRCDGEGKQDQRGGFWFWLQRPRTDQFIIETAARKGFEPRAWERLAA